MSTVSYLDLQQSERNDLLFQKLKLEKALEQERFQRSLDKSNAAAELREVKRAVVKETEARLQIMRDVMEETVRKAIREQMTVIREEMKEENQKKPGNCCVTIEASKSHWDLQKFWLSGTVRKLWLASCLLFRFAPFR